MNHVGGPHTPGHSGCMLLFMPASPTTIIHFPGELHLFFKTVRDASPPGSFLNPQRGMDVLSLNFPRPSSMSYHIVFTFPSALMSGKSLGAGAIPHSSSYAQYRTVYEGCCRHPVSFLAFESDMNFELLVKFVQFRFCQGHIHFLKSL